MALGFTSCQTANFNNFNKKKFTNLKPIEATYPEQDSEVSVQASALTENNSELNKNFKDDLDRLTENDPKIIAIQKAIKSKTPIIIKDGDLIYEVKKPFYDGIARSLIGDLVELDEVPNEEYLELSVDGVKESRYGLTEISTNDIKFYQSKSGLKEKVEEPVEEKFPDEEKIEKEKIEKEPVKQAPIQAMSAEQYQKSKRATVARKTFFAGLGFVVAMVITAAIFVLGNFWPLLIVLGILYLIAFILMCTSVHNSKLLRRELEGKNQRMNRKANNIRRGAIVFMILGLCVIGMALIGGLGTLLLFLIW